MAHNLGLDSNPLVNNLVLLSLVSVNHSILVSPSLNSLVLLSLNNLVLLSPNNLVLLNLSSLDLGNLHKSHSHNHLLNQIFLPLYLH